MYKRLLRNETLAPYTTYGIGGAADYFVTVNSSEELANAMVFARKEKLPYFVLGTGANILIGDKGFRGLVIHNQAARIRITSNTLVAESGATITEAIRRSLNKGLSGLEHFAGIPSSVGGALWQNLHFLSPDRSKTVFIAEFLCSALVLLEDNTIITVPREFFAFGYDDSILHHRDIIVLKASFQLAPNTPKEIQKVIQANLNWRSKRHPSLRSEPSCGSVFKKIDGVGAGRLIANAGLQGKAIGSAQISNKHANFIVNKGRASAQDVRHLIDLVQEKVLEETGHKLEPEISFVGEF